MSFEIKADNQYCSHYRCGVLLRGIEEMRFGVCEPHLKLMESKRNFIAICWNCGSITLIGDRQEVIRDRYIFAKGCKLCGNEEDSIQWMTIRPEVISNLSVNSKGLIVNKSSISNAINTNMR